jgi:hypothetical protein
MKLLIVSTPRSGNTWLRYMLASLYQLQQFAVHSPQELDWASLPSDSIVQLHWHRTLAFRELLQQHQFQPITIVRHPLAVLVSIWQFASHEPDTAKWLLGEGGNEYIILNQALDSQAFLDYACSPRAKALLSISSEWWNHPEVISVKYENLVATPEQSLQQLCKAIHPHHSSIQQVLSENTFEKLRPTASNNHFWQGSPYAWQEMLSDEFIQIIEQTHQTTLAQLGYSQQQGTMC